MLRVSRHMLLAQLRDRLDAGLVSPGEDYSRTPLEAIASDQEFIIEAFQRILRREPDLEAVLHFLGVLRSYPRSFVMDRLLEVSVAENASKLAPGVLPERDVSGGNSALGPASEGSASGIAVATVDSVIDLVSLDALGDPSEFIHEMYRVVLGRQPDFEGFVNYRDLLMYGISKIEVLARVAASAEAVARNLQFTWNGAPLPRPAPLSFARRFRLMLRQRLRPKEMEYLDRAMWRVGQETEHISEHQQSISAELGRTSAAVTAMDDSIGENAAQMAELEKSMARAISSVEGGMRHATDACLSEIAFYSQRVLARCDSIGQAIRPPVLTAPDVLVMRVDDFVLAVAREDWSLAAYYAFWETVDRGMTLYLQSILKRGMVVVDVGANIGIHTLHAARAVGATGMVHSFEPDPKTFRILEQNVRANGFQCVALYPVALLDRKCEVPLYRTEGISGWNTIYGYESGGGSVHVTGTTLDEALQHVDRIDVVKIDAEGAEPAILRGMERILERNPGIQLLIEYAPAHLRRAGVSPSEFLGALYARGFRIEEVDGLSGELTAVNPEQLPSVHSVNLCLRNRDMIAAAHIPPGGGPPGKTPEPSA